MNYLLQLAFLLALLLGANGWVPLAHAADEISTTLTFTSPTATSIGVAGDFSNWKVLPLTRGDAGQWSTTLQLKPGVYGYKFVIDDRDWVFDPANPRRKTSNDIENSALVVGTVPADGVVSTTTVPVTFRCNAPGAQSVHLAGQFNDWLNNVAGKVSGHENWQLRKGEGDTWSIEVPLKPGKYEFKYVIDGGDRWENDAALPKADNGNSVIEVRTPAADGGKDASFTLDAPDAKSVAVAGEFNKWSTTANPLQRDETGKWKAVITLKPGQHPYKFVVDGQWRQDPANPEAVPDGLGGQNSVRTVGP